jgi:hypothetical protein
MKKSDQPRAAAAKPAPSLLNRLSAPTSLPYELGGIAYTTATAPLIMWAFRVFSRH